MFLVEKLDYNTILGMRINEFWGLVEYSRYYRDLESAYNGEL